MNIFEALMYLINDAKRYPSPNAPYSSMSLERPMRTGYGVAMNQGSLDWMMSLAQMERQRELQRQETERMLDENWEREKWNYPYRGIDFGVGYGP